jgi:hypothetical protein
VLKHGDFKLFFSKFSIFKREYLIDFFLEKKSNGENSLEKNLGSRVETKIVQMTPNHLEGNF